jgi:hypothetical protein
VFFHLGIIPYLVVFLKSLQHPSFSMKKKESFLLVNEILSRISKTPGKKCAKEFHLTAGNMQPQLFPLNSIGLGRRFMNITVS